MSTMPSRVREYVLKIRAMRVRAATDATAVKTISARWMGREETEREEEE